MLGLEIVYCWACGKVVPDYHRVCPSCLALLYEPLSPPSTTGTSAWITWGNRPNISKSVTALGQSIEILASTYTGSLEQIKALESMGANPESLSLLRKSVEIMKNEADRQRRELTSSIKTQAWPTLESEAKKSEETRERQLLASAILKELKNCNLLSGNVLSGEFFNLGPEIVDAMHRPCTSEDDFVVKIGALRVIFEVGLGSLRSKVHNAQQQWKSINLLEEWAKQNSLTCDDKMFEVWRAIVDLRDASHPFHKTDDRVVSLVGFFGQDFPPDYSKLWRAILLRFLVSLGAFIDLLSRARALSH
jgi:hypothetical protein